MFTALGRFFNWVSYKFYSARMSIQYDTALNDLRKRKDLVKEAISKNFESVFDLNTLIDKGRLRIESNNKVVEGAIEFYSDDTQSPLAPLHRKEGEGAITKISQLSSRIVEWESLKKAHHATLLGLQRAHIELEEDLDFLRYEKPKALASFKATYLETSLYKRMAKSSDLDPHSDDHMSILSRYKNEQRAWRTTKEFLNQDPRDVYRERADQGMQQSPANQFDDRLRRRNRNVVDLVVIDKK